MVVESKLKVMEAVAESGQIPTGERLRPELNFTHLTPLEHALMGSSVDVMENGESRLISGEKILNSDDTFLLLPLGVTADGMDPVQILREREGKYIEGHFAIFHSRQMDRGGYHERIWLPTELQKDGTIKPVFRIQLITSRGEVVEEEDLNIDDLLKVTRRREYFELGREGAPEGMRLLYFRKAKPKAA
ncbi:MAG: hypothetical protein HYY87_00595 [Candidatus Levybacteria bacterium]|nr:hypothetical protein [Candidatus Levybacteria bacterium]MBI3069789.1 hypothetical protein [Candidatus Levybacteria bacterium]